MKTQFLPIAKSMVCLIALSTYTSSLFAQESPFVTIDEKALSSAISPNGKYVVGVEDFWTVTNIYAKSFLYNVETTQLDWFGEFDQEDLSKTTHFFDVNNKGVVAGATKSDDFTVSVPDLEGNPVICPLTQAAIWVNGNKTVLPFGDFDMTVFEAESDGSFAFAVSDDAKTVAGQISAGNSAFNYPVIWESADGVNYTFKQLPLPEEARGANVLDMSDDGSVILCSLSFPAGVRKTAYWKDNAFHVIELEGADAEAWVYEPSRISPNGKYFSFRLENVNVIAAIYDIEAGTYKKIPDFGDFQIPDKVIPVADNGDAMGYMGKPFFFSYKDGKTFDFEYYLKMAAPEVNPTLPTGKIYSVSADGSIIVGSNWVLEVNKIEGIVTPDKPEGLKGKTEALHQVELSWTVDKKTYEGLTLESYNIYRNGSLIKNVVAATTETQTVVLDDQPAGFPVYTVTSVFAADGDKKVESPESEGEKVVLPDNYNLPFYDNFDSKSFEANYWTIDKIDDEAGIGIIGLMDNYGVTGTGLWVTVAPEKKPTPYSVAFVSRPLDAKNEKKIALSFTGIFDFLNGTNQKADDEYLSVDITTDMGNTWETVKTMPMNDFISGYWSGWVTKEIDLTEKVAGKTFQFRFRFHGEGNAIFEYTMDVVTILTGYEADVPQGLEGYITNDNKLNLIWKTPLDVYQLNHFTGNITVGYVIGNEGKEFIAANSFDPEDLLPYKGKYITSISAVVNHYENPEGKDTKAKAVILVDNKIVREQEMGDIQYNREYVVALDEPFLIEADKEIKVGIRYYYHDKDQLPMTYQLNPAFKPGKSDIYSEDGGKTWQKVSDFYKGTEAPEQGYCCWCISANLSNDKDDVETAEPDYNFMGCNVFKNGEVVNDMLIRNVGKYSVEETDKDAKYTLRAYYLDGTASEMTEPFNIVTVAVEDIKVGEADFVYDESTNSIIAIDGTTRITVYRIDGMPVATIAGKELNLDGIQRGIYIIQTINNGRLNTKKVILGE